VIVPAETTKRDRTRAERVFGQLREDILSGVLAPGTKLVFPALSERYSASVGVTREALSRLSELGLVISEPQVGYTVPLVSIADLSDLTLARCQIEGAALVQSIEHGDLGWESDVVASHYALERTPVWRDPSRRAVSAEWEVLHKAFHAALLSACPSSRLINIAASLRDSAEIYRSWSLGMTLDAGHRDFESEHRDIKEAALARDARAASNALQLHLQRTADLLTRHLD
jgi:DNA-binding GntR family transcriptional regulator